MLLILSAVHNISCCVHKKYIFCKGLETLLCFCYCSCKLPELPTIIFSHLPILRSRPPNDLQTLFIIGKVTP